MSGSTAAQRAVAETIDQLRRRRNLTWQQVAERAGTSRRGVEPYGRRAADPRAATIARIAAALDVSVELFGWAYCNARPPAIELWLNTPWPAPERPLDTRAASRRLGDAVRVAREDRGLCPRVAGFRAGIDLTQLHTLEATRRANSQLATLARLAGELSSDPPRQMLAAMLSVYAGERTSLAVSDGTASACRLGPAPWWSSPLGRCSR